jgi:hypothetical protein
MTIEVSRIKIHGGSVNFESGGRRWYDLSGMRARKLGVGSYRFQLDDEANSSIVAVQVEIALPWSQKTVLAVQLVFEDGDGDDEGDSEVVRKTRYGLSNAFKYTTLIKLEGSSCWVKVMERLPPPRRITSKSSAALLAKWSSKLRFKPCDGVGFQVLITSR